MYRVFILFLVFWNLSAQIFQPVQFTSEQKKISKNKYELSIKVSIKKNWYVYSTYMKAKNIGIPISVNFNKDQNHYEKIGPLKEIGQLKKKYLRDLGFSYYFFSDEVVYSQHIRKLSSDPFKIKVLLEFQACSHDNCLAPERRDFIFYFNESKKYIKSPTTGHKKRSYSIDFFVKKQKSLWINILFFGFIAGIASVFMPCIFPMIPLTVSLFSRQIKNRFESIKKVLLYGIFIVLIYVFLGTFISIIFGASALNEISSSPWINLLFFVLFIWFALSFFGLFEIFLPSSWINAVDKKSRSTHLLSVFFMALILVLVSFSCTGPIIGTLLVELARGELLLTPIIVMLGFSLGLSLPFMLFAIFPSGLNALPRSGTWLQRLKISFGFIELALAMKFLSNADLIWRWNIIKREVFLVFWVVISFLLGLYLLGVFRFRLENSYKGTSLPAFFASIFSLSFSLYILPGIFGAPLQLLSGFIPPNTYSEYYPYSNFSKLLPSDTQKYIQDIPVFYDYEKGRNYAMRQLKPILLNFTGYTCANCRKMEEKIWADQRIKYLLSKKIVVISLHVDDRRKLPESESYFSNYSKRQIVTYGQKWADFQINHFKTNAQPYYVIVDYENQLMNTPIGAEFHIDKYIEWLKFGIEFFSSRNSL